MMRCLTKSTSIVMSIGELHWIMRLFEMRKFSELVFHSINGQMKEKE